MRRLLLLMIASLTPLPVHAYGSWLDYFSSSDWEWTDRLGLAFTDDCQETRGVAAIWAWASSWISGRQGRQRSAHCESREASCPPGVAVTGLKVRSGHVRRGGNRELYDFSLRCGSKWTDKFLGLYFDVREDVTPAAGVCPDGVTLTGVQVMRGRSEGLNARDYYTFKLRCERDWRSIVGLPFDNLKETRSATCPQKRSVAGIRVHRGFQGASCSLGSRCSLGIPHACLFVDAGGNRDSPAQILGQSTRTSSSKRLSMDPGSEVTRSIMSKCSRL